jgi:replication initiation and membrane attachment protein DnaB
MTFPGPSLQLSSAGSTTLWRLRSCHLLKSPVKDDPRKQLSQIQAPHSWQQFIGANAICNEGKNE